MSVDLRAFLLSKHGARCVTFQPDAEHRRHAAISTLRATVSRRVCHPYGHTVGAIMCGHWLVRLNRPVVCQKPRIVRVGVIGAEEEHQCESDQHTKGMLRKPPSPGFRQDHRLFCTSARLGRFPGIAFDLHHSAGMSGNREATRKSSPITASAASSFIFLLPRRGWDTGGCGSQRVRLAGVSDASGQGDLERRTYSVHSRSATARLRIRHRLLAACHALRMPGAGFYRSRGSLGRRL